MKRFLCFVFGHRYFVIRKYTPVVRRLGCHRCGCSWGMHDDLKALVPWDEELAEACALLEASSILGDYDALISPTAGGGGEDD